MTYVDGFVIAVPGDKRADFIAHAEFVDAIFIERGALRVVECWEDDVPDGKQTDFRRAVAATDGEKIAFAWIEWPSKAVRDEAMAGIMDDPRMTGAPSAPFDGKRMIFGGFTPVVDLRA
ncbi:DUF1428 domain-containing protein [Glacieibacterium frigidum]|uniref:DUF1428 domain-containing protein n=1 Tax=Glacieibacterium frigidum TaxID=2593303 RepID=A0A552UGX9_9SPHN|nr:DUF1428 domain-containing protein [Glacieibacterium frigidum]TRW17474.1 DUF1428 domain-containing protein [Glacieibacterium frigidum]